MHAHVHVYIIPAEGNPIPIQSNLGAFHLSYLSDVLWYDRSIDGSMDSGEEGLFYRWEVPSPTHHLHRCGSPEANANANQHIFGTVKKYLLLLLLHSSCSVE
jgi:hypothetical protein